MRHFISHFLLLISILLLVLSYGCKGSSSSSVPPGFNLGAGQDSLALVAGNTGFIAVNVVPSGGFLGDVQLSAENVPNGITVTFQPEIVSGGVGNSNLTITVAAGMSEGMYPVSLHGVSGELSDDILVTVEVVLLPPVRFSLETDVGTLAVCPGQNGETSVTLASIGGFSEDVQLAAVGAPAGVTLTFDPTTIAGGSGSSRVLVEVAPGTEAGIHTFLIGGTGAGWSDTAPISVVSPPAAISSGVALSLPSCISIEQGMAASVYARIARDSGVTGGVTLSLVSPPAGITCTFAENPSVTAGTMMTIQVGAHVAPGDYPLVLQGVCGSSSGTAGMMVRVGETAQPADAWISRVEIGQSFIGEGLSLVPGKPALVRAHVLADRASITSPVIRLTATRGVTTLGTVNLTGPVTLPTSESMATLAYSFTTTMPTTWVSDGLELEVEVDPGRTLAERDETNNKVRITPNIAGDTTLDLCIVPIILDGRTGSVPDVHDYLVHRWPLRNISIRVRAAYQVTSVPRVESSGAGWSSVLSEISALRQADLSSSYYYGVIKVDYGSGVAGMGYIGYPVAIGMDHSFSVAAHELGHNFGLRHAPCGGASSPDPAYPYTGGIIGTWGYDLGSEQLLSPQSTRDLMSYCTPRWVSDYNYMKVHKVLAPALSRSNESSVARPALLVNGTLAGGKVTLHPIQRVERPVPVMTAGSCWLTLKHAGGASIYPFTPVEIGCGPDSGGVLHFSLTIPDPGRITALEIHQGSRRLFRQVAAASASLAASPHGLLLEEQGGTLVVTWDRTVYDHVTVTHLGQHRTTLGQWLSGGKAVVSLRGLPGGGTFEVSLAKGLQGERVEIAR